MSPIATLPAWWRGGRGAAAFARRRFGFIDIGARDGLPTYWETIGPLLEVMAFEPDAAEAGRLTASLGRSGAHVDVIPSAVWNTAGRQTLHLTRSPGCSSLYRPRASFLAEFPDARRFEIVSAEEVDTVLLDSVVGTERAVRFIKIDAQGGALNILGGARQTLAGTLGLEVELELAPMYDEEPLFGDVDSFLRSQAFELVDLRPTYWRREAGRRTAGTRGQLVFADALYLLAPAVFASRVFEADPEGREHLCASALLICEVYGLIDWIAVYAAALTRAEVPSSVLHDYMSSYRPARLPAFPLRYHLGLWLKDLGDRLVESPDAWGVAEQRLGSKPRLGRHLAARAWRRIAGR